MHGGRGKQRGPNYSSTGRSSGKGQQKAAPECEQFPELHEEDVIEPAAIQEPPPYYSALGENNGSSSRAGRGAKSPVFTIGDEGEESLGGGGEEARPQIVTTYSAAPRVHQATAADDARYYQPASFPGYTVVQLINSSGDGGEGQALLARGGGRRLRRQHNRQQGSCVGRCCGHICRCVCFILGAVVLACLLCGATFLARQIIGSGDGSADWRCHGLLQHSDQHFSFSPQQQQQLVIESVDGVTQTNVHFVKGAWGVRAVVEASAGRILGVGVEHTDSALRVLGNGPSSRWPWWQVRGGCVRATLFIGIPPANTTTTTNSRLPSLEVSTGTGTVVADGVGPLSVSNFKLSLRNGSVQLHDFGVDGTLLVSTSNGPINATRVRAGMTIDLISSNGVISLDDVSAPSAVTAYASNAAVRARHVRAAYGVLQTSNGKVSLSDVHVSDKLILRTSNAAVDGDAAAEFVYARTSNGPINLRLSGGGGRDGVLHYVTLDTTNGAISLAATDFRGTFDVHTSNSRVAVGRAVESGSVPLSFTSSSTTHKTGVYGDDANTGNITLSATNARATLNFY
ncbi:hypothetical protein GGF44_001890 [Coemansia sp. RSA 1694]|nr:hypothetical protein GGF38_000221 [Coemansia sp. RSA 25]KAJ2641960.1 hypothetical protein GGF44_001890 [Coemansia sp. RSA 1694]